MMFRQCSLSIGTLGVRSKGELGTDKENNWRRLSLIGWSNFIVGAN
jgi:hypothetical protein